MCVCVIQLVSKLRVYLFMLYHFAGHKVPHANPFTHVTNYLRDNAGLERVVQRMFHQMPIEFWTSVRSIEPHVAERLKIDIILTDYATNVFYAKDFFDMEPLNKVETGGRPFKEITPSELVKTPYDTFIAGITDEHSNPSTYLWKRESNGQTYSAHIGAGRGKIYCNISYHVFNSDTDKFDMLYAAKGLVDEELENPLMNYFKTTQNKVRKWGPIYKNN